MERGREAKGIHPLGVDAVVEADAQDRQVVGAERRLRDAPSGQSRAREGEGDKKKLRRRARAWSSSLCDASCGSSMSLMRSTASWSLQTSQSCARVRCQAEHQRARSGYLSPRSASRVSRRTTATPALHATPKKTGSGRRRTPSHATMSHSSCGPRVVSVVNGEPTTNSFIDESPSERVTARTPARGCVPRVVRARGGSVSGGVLGTATRPR